MCFLFCDGITGLLADAVNWSHFPLTVFLMILRQCVTLHLHSLAFLGESAFSRSSKSWQRGKLLRSTVSATFRYLSSRCSQHPRERSSTISPFTRLDIWEIWQFLRIYYCRFFKRTLRSVVKWNSSTPDVIRWLEQTQESPSFKGTGKASLRANLSPASSPLVLIF